MSSKNHPYFFSFFPYPSKFIRERLTLKSRSTFSISLDTWKCITFFGEDIRIKSYQITTRFGQKGFFRANGLFILVKWLDYNVGRTFKNVLFSWMCFDKGLYKPKQFKQHFRSHHKGKKIFLYFGPGEKWILLAKLVTTE